MISNKDHLSNYPPAFRDPSSVINRWDYLNKNMNLVIKLVIIVLRKYSELEIAPPPLQSSFILFLLIIGSI